MNALNASTWSRTSEGNTLGMSEKSASPPRRVRPIKNGCTEVLESLARLLASIYLRMPYLSERQAGIKKACPN
jgi:hypothetical protein